MLELLCEERSPIPRQIRSDLRFTLSPALSPLEAYFLETADLASLKIVEKSSAESAGARLLPEIGSATKRGDKEEKRLTGGSGSLVSNPGRRGEAAALRRSSRRG